MKINVEGGTIELHTPTEYWDDNGGIVKEFQARAVSSHNGKTENFPTKDLATWWLKLIHEAEEGRKYRLSLQQQAA